MGVAAFASQTIGSMNNPFEMRFHIVVPIRLPYACSSLVRLLMGSKENRTA
jgi:hypothetical protein